MWCADGKDVVMDAAKARGATRASTVAQKTVSMFGYFAEIDAV